MRYSGRGNPVLKRYKRFTFHSPFVKGRGLGLYRPQCSLHLPATLSERAFYLVKNE
jgi:hypothetical protein